jgi:hypothetical protein
VYNISLLCWSDSDATCRTSICSSLMNIYIFKCHAGRSYQNKLRSRCSKSNSNGELHSRVFWGSHYSHIILKQFTYFLLQRCNSKKLISGPTILPHILIFYTYIILLALFMLTSSIFSSKIGTMCQRSNVSFCNHGNNSWRTSTILCCKILFFISDIWRTQVKVTPIGVALRFTALLKIFSFLAYYFCCEFEPLFFFF